LCDWKGNSSIVKLVYLNWWRKINDLRVSISQIWGSLNTFEGKKYFRGQLWQVLRVINIFLRAKENFEGRKYFRDHLRLILRKTRFYLGVKETFEVIWRNLRVSQFNLRAKQTFEVTWRNLRETRFNLRAIKSKIWGRLNRFEGGVKYMPLKNIFNNNSF
jgi:hypothetical protein